MLEKNSQTCVLPKKTAEIKKKNLLILQSNLTQWHDYCCLSYYNANI